MPPRSAHPTVATNEMPCCSSQDRFSPAAHSTLGASPPNRPAVLVVEAVEAGTSAPVPPGELERIMNAKATLLRTVYEEQPTERRERLPTKVVRPLLLEQ